MRQEAEQLTLFDQDIWSGRTYPVLSQAIEGKISELCLKKQSKSLNRMRPIFKCLIKGDGQNADVSKTWMEDGQLLTVLGSSPAPP